MVNASFFQLPRATQYAAWALLALAGVMIWDQSHWWQLRDEYAFGYIVPLFVAYVLYERWPRIAATLLPTGNANEGDAVSGPAQAPDWLQWLAAAIAVCMLVGGAFLFLLGGVYRAFEGPNLITSNFLAFGFANMLMAGAYLYSDERADGYPVAWRRRLLLTSLFLFPAIIWMLSVPLFSAVHLRISTFLMNQVAVVVFHTFDVLGFAIIREGSVLQLPAGDVGVEDACSGIRSLTACLFAGSFLGAVYFEQLWKKVFMVATAMLFAFINNIFRSLFLTGWAYAKGPDALNSHVYLFGMDLGNIHDFTGWVVLGFTVIGLLLCIQLFSIRFEYEDPDTA